MRGKVLLILIAAMGLFRGASATAAEAAGEKVGGRWAILIGVDDYAEANKLRFCGADMQSLAQKLIGAGFSAEQVLVLHDNASQSKYRPLKPNIERQLGLVLDAVERGDLVVVGFSGHGVHLNGKSYLCPEEARLEEPATLISLEGVYEKLQRCSASFKLLLVDACRNDPRPGGTKSLTPTAQSRQFAQSLDHPPEGILLLTSCAPGQISWEDESLGHGVFMHFVLEGLDGAADVEHQGRVSLTELYRYVNQKTKSYVIRQFNNSQTPALKGDINDDFALALAHSAHQPPGPNSQTPAGPSEGGEKTLTNSIGMKLVLLPAGEFMMGSSAEEIGDATAGARAQVIEMFKEQARKDTRARNLTEQQIDRIIESPLILQQIEVTRKKFIEAINSEQPRHRVRITKPFYLGKYPVTLGQFLTFYHDADYRLEMERDGKEGAGKLDNGEFGSSANFRPWAPGGWKPDMDHPVVWVTWNDAQAFCQWLSKKEGKTYRLPTEAQWEYACRAGTTTQYYFGDSESQLGDYAWYNTNAVWGTKPVGGKRPNAWGLYDMHGNVWQWCADWYNQDYYAASPADDPQGPEAGSARVNRGGSWINYARGCRAARRERYEPGDRGSNLGFRVCQIPGE
jgi:formylglycine-generating enzyme required for sulfatase activity